MTNDVFLVIGIVVLTLAIPAVVSAISDKHPPRAAAIMVLIGGVLVVLAMSQKPNGYTLEEIPDVFMRVIKQALP